MVTITKRADIIPSGSVLGLTYNTSGDPTGTAYGTSEVFQNGNHVKFNYFQTGGSTPSTSSSAKRLDSFHTFMGITIPQGAIINSAVLTFRTWQTNTQFKIGLKAHNDPNAYFSNISNYTDPSTVRDRMLGNFTGFVKTTPTGTQDAVVTKLVPNNGGPAGTFPDTTIFDVQDLVQKLVDNFDYNNQNMMFQIGGLEGAGNTDLSFYMYTQYNVDGSFPKSTGPSTPVTTATSQGTSVAVPKLVIDYSLPVTIPVLRSCRTVDALIIAKGDILGRCKNGGP